MTTGSPIALPRGADPAEVERFRAQAARWWDPAGPAGPLHVLNPLRMAFVAEHASPARISQTTPAAAADLRVVTRSAPADRLDVEQTTPSPLSGPRTAPRHDLGALATDRYEKRGLHGVAALDVGCGGGLVAEGLARAGAQVLAIDPTPELLEVARLHALESELTIDYRQASSAELLPEQAARYSVVTALELIEHVPDQPGLMAELAQLLAPGGRLFLSTLDRKPASFLLGIVAAEYLLGLLPRGTHRYDRFLRPSELIAMGRAAGLYPVALEGLGYDPLLRRAWRTPEPQINYLLCLGKP